MDIHNVRQQMKTKSIFDIPLRVTYYARVSSESDEQLNSLSNQIGYYQEFIEKNKAWAFVPGYIDEGLSGISTKHRENFNKMIDDASTGKFDLIITKEISRFARNTLDSIQYTRQLLNSGVGVFFQNDNINTLDEDSELRLSIMSSIAQDELRKLSSRVKFGHQQAIKNSVVLGNSRIFGYKKENKKLVIDESQAQMVRELFEMYASKEYSMKQIENIFWEKGYRNLNGNKIVHSTMVNIISNPKYKGYYVGNKVKVVDMFTKKQKFLPPEEWVMYKDESGEIVPAIVSEELWDRANEVLKQRSEDVKKRQGVACHENILVGKLYCAKCGTSYYRRDSFDRSGNLNSKWICSGKIKNGKDSCNSFGIYESELKPLLFEVFKDTKESALTMIAEYEEMYDAAAADKTPEKQIAALKSGITLAEKKKSKLLELVTVDSISASDFKNMTASCNEEIKKAEEEISELKSRLVTKEEFRKNMEHIRKILNDAENGCLNGSGITRDFVEAFIDKIYVTPQDDDTMRLDIKVLTGKNCEKYLRRLRRNANLDVHTGHIIKKICPERTLTYIRNSRNAVGHIKKVKYRAVIGV